MQYITGLGFDHIRIPIDDEVRYQWYCNVKEILKKNNIAWATWDCKGGFGMVRNGKEDKILIEILTGHKD